jgi:C1A family cysteine protease
MPFEYTEEYLRTHTLGANFDKPDKRDLKFPHATPEEIKAYPSSVDLRSADPPIFNQGGVGSCVAQAGVAIFEWLERRVDSSKYFAGSKLAIYKWARDLDGTTGDVGTSCRQGARTLATYGVPHESLWPYNEGQYDVEPPSNVRADAANYKATSYYTISTGGGDMYTTVNDIKKSVSIGYPVMFSFLVYPGYDAATSYGGKIGLPQAGESPRGGHANVIVGYYDGIQNRDGGYGAFVVRNSWGTSWGVSGYGYMPYTFASQSLINSAWVVSGESGLQPAPAPPGPAPGPPAPGPNDAQQFTGFTDINILDYIAKTHNGQPTPGNHQIIVYLPTTGSKGTVRLNVEVREHQQGLE